MSWLRPEVVDLVWRGREVIAGAAVTGLGLWLAAQGGYLLLPVGGALTALGMGWMVMARRRLRFDQGPDGPGLVDLDEGQVGYLGPGSGGYVSLADLTELRLLRLRGRKVWRLKQADGQALLIPVDAAGAERLFDAFASLPGMDTAALVAALDGVASAGAARSGAPPQGGEVATLAASSRLIWTRGGALEALGRRQMPGVDG